MKNVTAVVFSGLLLLFCVGCEAPSFSPISGAYIDDIDVTISCESGYDAYYTTDGTTPSKSSTMYTDPIPVEGEGAEVMIKAIAVKGVIKSPVSTAVYSIIGNNTKVSAPHFSVAGGTYESEISVELTTITSGAVIHYETTGVEPDNTSPIYEGPIVFSEDGNYVIKAYAEKYGMEDSDISVVEYTIQWDQVTRPILRPDGGTYQYSINAEILTTSIGASTYFTVNGGDPDESSTEYVGQNIILDGGAPYGSSVLIKARSYKAFMIPSEITEVSYTVDTSGTLNTVTTFEDDMGMNGWLVAVDDNDLDYGLSTQAVWSGERSFRIGESDCWGAICSDDNLKLYKEFDPPIHITKITAHVYKKTGSTLGTGQLEINDIKEGGSDDLSAPLNTWREREWNINKNVYKICFSYRKITRYDKLFIDDINIE